MPKKIVDDMDAGRGNRLWIAGTMIPEYWKDHDWRPLPPTPFIQEVMGQGRHGESHWNAYRGFEDRVEIFKTRKESEVWLRAEKQPPKWEYPEPTASAKSIMDRLGQAIEQLRALEYQLAEIVNDVRREKRPATSKVLVEAIVLHTKTQIAVYKLLGEDWEDCLLYEDASRTVAKVRSTVTDGLVPKADALHAD